MGDGGTAKYEQLAAALLEEITSGRRPPGSTFPSQRDLAAEHGDYVAKEALRWLRDHGWIMTRVGSGATVADPLPESGRSLAERLTGVEERAQDQERRLAIVEDQLRRLLQAQRGQRADTTDH